MRSIPFIIVLVTAALAPAQRELGSLTAVQAPEGASVRAALLGDMNGDGADDLVVAVSFNANDFDRRLHVHLRRTGGAPFGPKPDRTLALPPDAVAFAVGDVHADRGAEVVLLSATGAFVWRTTKQDRGAVARLGRAEVLWQMPHPRRVFAWADAVQDVTGDGLVDLILPEDGGYVVLTQERDDSGARFTRRSTPRLPLEEVVTEEGGRETRASRRARRARRQLVLQLRMGASNGPRNLVEVEEQAPAPMFRDWDADGDLDIVARTVDGFHVWKQDGGAFPTAPDVTLAMPVIADRSRTLDVSYSALLDDIDGDRRADCVVFSGDQRSEDIITQVQVFVQGRDMRGRPRPAATPLFGGAQGIPTALLKLEGFAGVPALVDVDGDGRLDLACGAVRPDLIDTLRSAKTEEVEAELYVFRNLGGRFSGRPDVTFKTTVKMDGIAAVRSATLATFLGDITGDGVAELMVRDRPDRIRFYLVRARRGAIQVFDKPLREINVSENADISIHRNGRTIELLVNEGKQVVHVRFK